MKQGKPITEKEGLLSRNRYEVRDFISADLFVVNWHWLSGLVEAMLMMSSMVVLSSRMLQLASYGLCVGFLWVLVKQLWPRSQFEEWLWEADISHFYSDMASSLLICTVMIASSRISHRASLVLV